MTPGCPRRPAARRAGLLAVLAAFVLAQCLGMVHRAAHAVHAPTAVSVHAVEAHGQHGAHDAAPAVAHAPDHAVGHGHAHAESRGLFDDHQAGDAECRLLDAIGQEAPLPPSPQVALLPSVQGPAVRLRAAQVTAREAAHFDARGPPVFL